MPLLTLERFAHVLDPLLGKRIGYVRPKGNVGDRLIEWATFQMFDSYGLRWTLQSPDEPADVDELVFGGGGNMGTFYMDNWNLRSKCLALGPPVTILPQSFLTPEDRPFHRVFAREHGSLKLCPQAQLAPDLAMGLDYGSSIRPRRTMGLFIRADRELAVRRPWRARDPVKLCKTPEQYLQLAVRYERIVTDRLHFAICGLLLGRETTILPNSYHKNKSMYETWLRDCGCKFAASVKEALRPARARHWFSLRAIAPATLAAR